MRRRVAGLVLLMLCAVRVAPARGEDSDRPRWYLGGRFDLFSLTHTHDFVGGEIGLNIDRYFGVELSERSLVPEAEATLGESRFDDWLNRR